MRIVQLRSDDETNRLTRECVLSLAGAVEHLAREKRPIVFTGNDRFFSAGAELEEIAALDGPTAYEFSRMGQTLMGRSTASLPRFMPPCRDAAWEAGLTWRWLAITELHRGMPCSGTGAQRWG